MLVALPAHALELWSGDEGDASISLNTSVKWTSILTRAPGDTVFFPEEWSAASLGRFRADLEAGRGDWLSAKLA